MNEAEDVAVGIHVAKATLEVAVRPSGDERQVANDPAGIAVVVAWLQRVQPSVIVVEATGRLAKTDWLDAQAQSHFGQAVRPTPRPLRDEEAQALAALVERRRQVVAMRTAEEHRLGATRVALVRTRIQAHPDWTLGLADEVWWSRLAQPHVHAWTEQPLRLIEQTVAKADPDPQALACYGLLLRRTRRQEEVWLRFVTGWPLSAITLPFLDWRGASRCGR
jgi:transposase